MSKNTKSLLQLLAEELSLQYKFVKKWYETNLYDTQQLEVINRQVTDKDITIHVLVGAITHNIKYRISIY
jgi:hypothetical protein